MARRSRRRIEDDHDCQWRDEVEQLRGEVGELKAAVELQKAAVDLQKAAVEQMRAEMESMKRRLLGPKSEKMPPIGREVRAKVGVDPAAAQAKRLANAKLRSARVVDDRCEHKVPDDQRKCPKCGHGDKLKPVGKGKETVEWEYVAGYFRRRIHVRETLACTCGQHIIAAPGPDRVWDRVQYGAGFIAFLVVAKCGDSIPLYRLEKHFRRIGIPVARSTMTDLFHRAAELLAPLVARMLALIRAAPVVRADETSIKMLGATKRAFMWAFLCDEPAPIIAYRFSPSRSGETAGEVLGSSQGTLVVDMYTGYNQVTSTGRRTRAACLAHARRHLFEALSTAPEAADAIDLIRDVYVVEHEAKLAGVARTAEHRAMRQSHSRPIMDRLRAWLEAKQDTVPPKSPLGSAIGYVLNNWVPLTRFLDDEKVPPDNNASEAALRVVALGRKNYLFVGNEDAGNNVAGLYSLVATCEANGVNPLDYLVDVMRRIQDHPAVAIDDLLPHRWKPRAA
jgi:transposase